MPQLPEPRTLCELFQFALEDLARERAYQFKVDGTYSSISSRQFADRVEAIASALRQSGVQPGDRVAIVSPNRLEWAIVLLIVFEIVFALAAVL